MSRIEEKILQLPNWPKLCSAVSIDDQGCSSSSYDSFVKHFPQPSTVTQSELDAKLTELTTEPTYTKAKGLFDKGFSSTNKKSSITRANFMIGAPLEIDGTRYTDK